MGLFDMFSKKDKKNEENALAQATDNVEKKEPVSFVDAFDWETSMQFLESKEMIDEVAHAFAGEIDEYVEKLNRLAASASDEEAVKQYRITAHSAKSTCKMLGNMKLAKVAEECEYAARDNDIAGITEKTPLLTEGLKSVQEYLRTL